MNGPDSYEVVRSEHEITVYGNIPVLDMICLLDSWHSQGYTDIIADTAEGETVKIIRPKDEQRNNNSAYTD